MLLPWVATVVTLWCLSSCTYGSDHAIGTETEGVNVVQVR